jgi:hypothetical protein
MNNFFRIFFVTTYIASYVLLSNFILWSLLSSVREMDFLHHISSSISTSTFSTYVKSFLYVVVDSELQANRVLAAAYHTSEFF